MFVLFSSASLPLKVLSIFVLVLFLTVNEPIEAQVSIEWVETYGNKKSDFGIALEKDERGNYYVGSRHDSSITVNGKFYTINYFVIRKLNASKELVWEQKSDQGGKCNLTDLVLDQQGNLYITGTFMGTMFANSRYAVKAVNNYDLFILKLNTRGEVEWLKSFGGEGYDYGSSLQVDKQNNVYLSGRIMNDSYASRFEKKKDPNKQSQFFVWKLKPDGQMLWKKFFPGINESFSSKIALDSDNNIYMTGTFFGSGDFDPGKDSFHLKTNGYYDVFILKLNSKGELIWAKSMGGQYHDFPAAIEIDFQNNLILTGHFSDSMDMNPDEGVNNHQSTGCSDIFILKISPEGDYIWSKSLGNKNFDKAEAVISNQKGDIYVTGNFYNASHSTDSLSVLIKGDSTKLYSQGASDVLVLKLDSKGNFQWIKSFGSSQSDYCPSIELGENNQINLLGTIEGTVDLNSIGMPYQLPSKGEYDIFFIQLKDD